MTTFLILFAIVGFIGAFGAVNNLQHSEAPTSISPDEPHHNAIFYRCCAAHMAIVCFISMAGLAGQLRIQMPMGLGMCMLFSLHVNGAAYLISRAVVNSHKSRMLQRWKTKPSIALHPMVRGR